MDNLTPITREEKLWNGEDLEPITREEMYIKRIFDKTQKIPDKPLTRKEILMEKAGEGGGGDVTIKQLSVTANGTYSEKGTAYSPVNVNVPMPENAYLLKTASGSLVSFTDGADLPMPSFICNIDAVQDLHGQDGPWVGGAGKNKCPQLITEFTYSANAGGSHTANDGVLAVSVTSTNNSGVYTSPSFVESYSQVCSYSMDIKADVSMNALVGFTNFGRKEVSLTNQWQRVTFDNVTFDGSTQTLVIYGRGTAGTISVKNFMFELGSVSHDYAPYSNICPISGHTGLDAWVFGKNILPYPYTDTTKSLNGVTFTDVGDGTIKTSGTASARTVFKLKNAANNYTPPKGTYILSKGYQNNYTTIIVDGYNGNTWVKSLGRSASVDDTEIVIDYDGYDRVEMYIEIFNGIDISNITFKPMMRLATIADTTYEPYNPQSQTIQVSWETEVGEVFGGYVDLVSGVLTVTHKSQTGFTRGSQDSTHKLYSIGFPAGMKRHLDGTISPYFIDNMFEKMSLANARASEIPSITQYNNVLYVGGYIGKAAELDTLLESLQVKYELETPITYQLTPTQIKSLLGNNNAWCSTGDVDIDYFAKEV